MPDFQFFPLTPERWEDFERLFGPRGACGGCWCLYWKRRGKLFTAGQGEPNRLAQKEYVQSGHVPGLLAYQNGEPVGWIAVEPRPNYAVLAHSRVLKEVDDTPVWSVTCFFIARPVRRLGLSVALLEAAIEYVARKGGKVLEGYPTDLQAGKSAVPAFIYTGVAAAFRQAGFVEVARRSPTRPVMRFKIR
jgi:GNAT superfamily N-acetyltransferase